LSYERMSPCRLLASRGIALFAPGDEPGNQLGVELTAGAALKLGQGGVFGDRTVVGPVGDHRREGVQDGDRA